ncbi:DUF4157 domain-containing protein [Bradyrhizobium hipponense]|uniref:DUF4157 domain-containing protein n=2 Tax=Bradyrhizobium hipponense TaxID=2605638 RepID=A0A5S4YHI9_9BRAD|nr:DUF4157 domain-containing protein [Bradyrhizobium hipponense]
MAGQCDTCKGKGNFEGKLTVGAANDALEHEADRAADHVLREPASAAPVHPIQRFATTAGSADVAPSSVERALAGPGTPLHPRLQQDMELSFGYDFSKVRLHTDDTAAQSARDISANAYTSGNDVVFGAGKFSPESPGGRRLLAHELAHVVQQNGSAHGRSSMSGDALVQRDTTSFPSISPDVAASWGMPPPPAKDSENAHGAPLEHLRPKQQPRTEKEILEAANADPHKAAKPDKETPPPGEEEIMKMSAFQKLSRAVYHARESDSLREDVKAEIDALFTPQAIAAMAFFGAVYIAAQLTPAGWVADALALTALTISFIFMGAVLLDIMKNLSIFVSAVSARTDSRLQECGHALTRAIAKAGVALVVALITRTARGSGTPYTGAPSSGFADAVTPDGLVVRAPVEAILEPKALASKGPPGSIPPSKPVGDAKSDSQSGETPDRKKLVAQLDTRIADVEAELNPARQKALDYKDARKAEGKSLKGGDMKSVWNVKERIWLLKRQKANPDRTILEQADVVGVKAHGSLRPAADIAGEGRTLDFVEQRGNKTVGGDLKSASELQKSVAGGVKRPGPIEGDFRPRSKIGGQHEVEAKILAEARKQNGKIVVRGKNILTGQVETIEVDPANYSSEVINYEEVLPN